LQRVLAIDENHGEARVDLGVIALADGRYAEAVALFERVRELSPDDLRCTYYHALTLGQLEREAEAASELEELSRAGSGKYSRLAEDQLSRESKE
ncbi:tetratricopeptide repeat protein, partial [Candidatus Bipolaricaulota bacterium]|nr:tetratricopeptide repeat protein [Candidatus Bipolaricaulota bacterium]